MRFESHQKLVFLVDGVVLGAYLLNMTSFVACVADQGSSSAVFCAMITKAAFFAKRCRCPSTGFVSVSSSVTNAAPVWSAVSV